jgi:hypothetical protein
VFVGLVLFGSACWGQLVGPQGPELFRKTFAECGRGWGGTPPSNPNASRKVSTKLVHGKFSIGCEICAQLAHPKDQDIIARYGITKAGHCKLYRFLNHADTTVHLNAVLKMLKSPTTDEPDAKAPSTEELQALLAWLRKGQGIREGVLAVGGWKKCRKLVFVLAEALKRLYREWLRQACTINLLRDERHTRLLLRFRAANFKAKRFIGILGQLRVTKACLSDGPCIAHTVGSSYPGP